jgi:hypothetical protein
MFKRTSILCLTLAAAANLFAQTNEPQSLAALVLSETPALDTAPDLARWRTLHPNEHLRAAAYDNEYESQGLWCAASVAEVALADGLHATRQAFFYVRPAKAGDALPARQDPGLVRQCRLLALWYEVHDPSDPGGMAKSVSAELSASLGAAEEPSRFKRPDGDWGSGYWNPYLLWARANRRVVLAFDPGGFMPDPKAHTRLLVIARAEQAPRRSRFDWMGEAPKGQPSLKACAFDDGRNNWQDGLIRAGEKLLRDSPASRAKSDIQLTIARAYDAKLILTYPDVDLNGANQPTDPEALRRDAIAHFRAFFAKAPNSPESAVARREAWRLLAGLPPTPIHFACTD